MMLSSQKIACAGKRIWRIISSRFPTVHVFEAIADASDFDALYALEARTNDRLRHELGAIQLVPREEWVFGPGAGYIMAAFTHCNPVGSRFSDGSYGVYYGTEHVKTAIAETKYHMTQFLSYTKETEQVLDMRVLTAQVNADLHDIRGTKISWPHLYHETDYRDAQGFARALRKEGAEGIIYDSVRDQDGICVAIFRANLLSRCVQERHLRYYWDGSAIAHVYEIREVA